MEQMKAIIHKLLSEKLIIDWLIVHDISKSNIEIFGVEFSFVDGKERRDEAFKTNQGYISLKTPSSITEFTKVVTELTEEFKSNSLALANLFIIISRTSYSGEEKEVLIKKFKKHLGKDICQKVFNLLIASLNSEYYKDSHSFKSPKSTNDWLEILRSAEYMHSISDPLINCLQLVMGERNRNINFEIIENMKPLLRAVLIGQYGFYINISTKKIKLLYRSLEELTFLSACLIDASEANKTSPNWLTENLVKQFVETHWDIIGKGIFVHAFGFSYRNKNRNKLYENLEDLIHAILVKKLLLD